ncbi:hypothetical protein QBC46DRAFT_310127 [Diplogelasinospora grovesii]|uniref:Cyanovirin-N domain-containing protein n=1 Tax=Diplogelasinospora grovesii TaxID=303347 RepID=A0AAN6S6B4_9PEZI|nr:hypothetical protein QBC46DRAFT_310127 [Diplogelasinospora grovesii]
MIADEVSDVVSSTAEARAVPTHSIAPGSATTWNGIPLGQLPNGPDAPSSSFRQDSAISPTPNPVPQINPGANITGGFMNNCYSYYFGQYGEQVNKFYALCSDDITQNMFHNTYINLDECLVNLNGGLFFGDQGIGLDTCNHCQSRKNYTNWLDCWCENDNPGWFNQTSIDLNVGIYYDTYNHVLACFDNMGVLDGPSLERV